MSTSRELMPRSTPAAEGVSSRAIAALLDRLEADSAECHSLMVARRGKVVAEGWWAPFSADRPHLLYSLTKTVTSMAVGIAIGDGLLALDDRVVDVLPDHVPADVSDQARRITVHHLLSMTTGHDADSLVDAWQREPGDLVKGFLRVPFPAVEGTRHAYDNPTTFVLARMLEKVTGQGLPEFVGERILGPIGVGHAEWDRVASGAAFGFHGLHLTTEAVAAFGELLRRDGRWGERQLIPRDYVRLATRQQVETAPGDADYRRGYGYQTWISRHGFHGDGSFGQLCVVVPAHDLVVAMTGAHSRSQAVLDAIWDCLLPGLDHPATARDDERLADRLRRLSLEPIHGAAAPERSAEAKLADGTTVAVDPVDGGWRLRIGPDLLIEAGHGTWRESAPLGRPAVTMGAWQGDTFLADLYVITTPHRIRLTVDAVTGTATATWNIDPLTGTDLTVHLRSPLMTRPDVA